MRVEVLGSGEQVLVLDSGRRPWLFGRRKHGLLLEAIWKVREAVMRDRALYHSTVVRKGRHRLLLKIK